MPYGWRAAPWKTDMRQAAMTPIGPTSRRRRGSRALAIYAATVAFLSTLPLLILFPVSLNPQPMVGLPEKGLSLAWYAKVFQATNFPEAFLTSCIVALTSTGISLVAGSLAAWALTRSRFRGVAVVEAFLLSPLLLARIIYGIAMLIVLTQIGLIRTTPGLIIAHAVIVMPYVVRIVGGSLIGIQRSLEEAAAVLGANQFRIFVFITLPLLRPALLAATIFGFITSFDEFTMTVFLVGAQTKTLPVEIFRYAELIVDPAVAAVSVMLILATLLGIALLEKTLGLEKVLKA
jgi:putative spermidine/putrescine transport system permease protein